MTSLPEDACQLMLYCRTVAVLTEEAFLAHYQNQLSQTAKRQLRTFPAINSNQRICTFPWNPPTPSGIVQSWQEHSPALSQSVPSAVSQEQLVHQNLPYNYTPVPQIGNELQLPRIENIVMDAVDNAPEPVVNRRRRRSIESSIDSEESYVPPKTRSRNTEIPVRQIPRSELAVEDYVTYMNPHIRFGDQIMVIEHEDLKLKHHFV